MTARNVSEVTHHCDARYSMGRRSAHTRAHDQRPNTSEIVAQPRMTPVRPAAAFSEEGPGTARALPRSMPTAESVVRPHALLPPSTDRREHFRAPLAGPVLVDALSQWHRARCENVSVGGVAVAGAGRLPIGKTVEVYFELPSGVAVEAQAQVVRSRGEAAALRFLALDSSAEIALRAHCRAAGSAEVSG